MGNEKGEEKIRERRGHSWEGECPGVKKILKIDLDERLYLFKRMTYVHQQLGRALID